MPSPMQTADAQAWLQADDATRQAWSDAIPDPTQARALAWALHDEARALRSRDASVMGRAAHALGLLARRHAGSAELASLSAWNDGQWALIEGRMADAHEALARASAGFAALGDERHAAQALVPQLMALSMLGRHAEAAALAQDLVQRFTRQGDDAAAGRTELNLGSLLMRQDNYADSAAAYRAAAVRFARAGDRPHSVMADIGLALALTWQCSFDEAARILARAASRAQAHGLPALQALADTNRGRLALLRGEHAQALGLLESARRLTLAAGAAPQRLEVERHLADAYLSLQLLPEALELYSGLLKRADAGTAVECGWIELRCAELQLRRAAPRAAASHLARARLSLAANPVGRAACTLLAAQLALGEADTRTAAALAAEARAGFEAAGVRAWALHAGIVEARISTACGRPGAALEQLAQLWPDLPAATPAEVQAEAWLARADARRRLGAADADTDAEAALARLEQEQAGLPDDEFRVAHGALAERAHVAWLDLLGTRRPAPSPMDWLRAIDRGRGGALALAMSGRDTAADAGTSPADDAWRWLHREWQSALAAGRDDEAARLLARLREAESAWQADRRHVVAVAVAAAATPTAAAPAGGHTAPATALDEAALHAALGPERALVAYHCQGDQVMACVVRGGQVQLLQWHADELPERIAGTRFQIEALRGGAAALGAHAGVQLQRTERRLHDLGRCLWQPVAAAVGTASEVILLPHGLLHGVPFAALIDDDGRLLERHAFVRAPSVAGWQRLAAREAAAELASGSSGGLGAGPVVLAGHGGPHLPEVARELQQIAAGLGGRAELLPEATLDAVRQAAPRAAWLHLACHGHFRSDNPGFSALHLADGALSLHEVSRWRLQARLVTLSACETGVGRLRAGEELIGLVRGFLVAGASRVLASQWTVADDATADLMTHFYAALRTGTAPARALQQAQRAVAGDRPHPFHWAAFGLHGTG
jgi:CHAT domain-containing protein